MDLFTPIMPTERLHPNFRTLIIPIYGQAGRDTIQSWASGFVDRDGKLVKEFQTTFNSTFWELYLHAAFRELGFKSDFRFNRPDFVLSGETSLIAEATIASHPVGFTPEWEREISVEALKRADSAAIIELATVRLASSIVNKSRMYLDSYGSLEHVRGLPFVLCVAPFEQPFFYFQSDQAIRRVLYGYDQPLWVEEGGHKIIIGESLVNQVRKATGTDIELGLFTRPGLEHVSAVIFSTTATMGKVRALSGLADDQRAIFRAFRYAQDAQHHRVIVAELPDYKEDLIDGLHVLLNPFATTPLDIRPFRRSQIAFHSFDPVNKKYITHAEDGFLFYRDVQTLVFSQNLQHRDVGRKGASAFKAYEQTVWPEKVLMPVGGFVWPSGTNYMAHYRGWTIVVYQDRTDNDWGGQAIETVCKDLANFRRLNAEERRSVIIDDFFATKEEVVTRAIIQIDRLMTAE